MCVKKFFLTALILVASQFFVMAQSLQVQVVAHRGVPTLEPENTLESIALAYALGATWVETDFHALDSGKIICIHCEKTLKALSGVDKKIKTLSDEDLKNINLGLSAKKEKQYKIPQLEEILSIVPKDKVLQAEIKGYSATYAADFDKAVKASGLSHKNIVVSSFSKTALADFKSKCPNYDTMLLVTVGKNTAEKIIEDAKFCGVKYVALGGFMNVDSAFVQKILDAGFEFRTFGVNDENTLKHALKLGSKGFTTNHYQEMLKTKNLPENVELLP